MHQAAPRRPVMSSPWAVALFVVAAAVSLGASAVLVVRLERVGARLGWSEALLGLVAALAADTPEVTSAVTALAHGQHDVGTGVVLGSNVFNLAALIGLGAVVAGGIKLHRRVVLFEGAVALWIAALSIAAVMSLITPVAALVLALAVLAPYVYVSAVHPSGRSALPLPPRLRSWLAGAVAEEEQELSDAIHPERGGPRDAAFAVLALAVVVAASAAMERTASALGARWAVPGVITGAIVLAAVTSLPNAVAAVFLARRGRASATLSEAFNSNTLNVLAGLLLPAVIITGPSLGGALPIAIWYGVLSAATIALALAGRGINRRSGALIIAAYLVFAITVIATAARP
jgi:cation:H+ antiporter